MNNKAVDIPIYGGYDRVCKEENSIDTPSHESSLSDYYLYVVHVTFEPEAYTAYYQILQKVHITEQLQVHLDYPIVYIDDLVDMEKSPNGLNILYLSGDIFEVGESFDYISVSADNLYSYRHGFFAWLKEKEISREQYKALFYLRDTLTTVDGYNLIGPIASVYLQIDSPLPETSSNFNVAFGYLKKATDSSGREIITQVFSALGQDPEDYMPVMADSSHILELIVPEQ